jgi:hypothetical protein
MAPVFRLLVVAAYLAAALRPCAEPEPAAPAPALLRAYSAAALHAHGATAASERPDGELRAPCPCGCDETPAGRLVSSPLGAALVPWQGSPALPRAARPHAPPARPAQAAAQTPDPVPRLA